MARVKFSYRATVNGNQLNLPVEGEDSRSYGFVEAMHKRPMEWSPFLLANEYISTRLGEYIGLPVPPCVFSFIDSPECPTLFSELNFNPGGDELPRIDPDYCVEFLPIESAGVLMFDIWIANADRHENNLAVDVTNGPRHLRVFDHCNALFGAHTGLRECGIPRLRRLQYNRLGITGSTVTGGYAHCLLGRIQTAEHFSEWINRITTVPDYVIEKLCTDVKNIAALDQAHADAAIEFLKYRKHKLGLLVETHRDQFSGISTWTKPGELFV